MTYWITDYLGTCSIFESIEPGVIVVDVRDLSDFNPEIKKVRQRIELITGLIMNGAKVVIRCVAGINRSNVFACATLCLIDSKQLDLEYAWNVHWREVKECVPRAQPVLELVDIVKKALQETNHFR